MRENTIFISLSQFNRNSIEFDGMNIPRLVRAFRLCVCVSVRAQHTCSDAVGNVDLQWIYLFMYLGVALIRRFVFGRKSKLNFSNGIARSHELCAAR